LPTWFLLVFIYNKTNKIFKFLYQKINEIKTLDRIKNEILQKRIQETKVEDIWSTDLEIKSETL
jgi:hypothetical protein